MALYHRAMASEQQQGSSDAGGIAISDRGFVGQLVKSVFEPGANPAAVLAMNVSFFLLLLTLFALAFLTHWNKHVLILLGVTTCLWACMLWFVIEITKLQNRPDNMPASEPKDLLDAVPQESRKDQ